MVGENGSPETPDWDVQHVIHVTRDEFEWLMQPGPDAVPQGLRDIVLEQRGELPERFELGEN